MNTAALNWHLSHTYQTLPPLFYSAVAPADFPGYLYLCLVGAVLAYALFFRGIRLLPPAVVSSLGLLSPVCAFALGWVFLDQRLSLPALLGFGLVLCAIYGVQRALQGNASGASA